MEPALDVVAMMQTRWGMEPGLTSDDERKKEGKNIAYTFYLEGGKQSLILDA